MPFTVVVRWCVTIGALPPGAAFAACALCKDRAGGQQWQAERETPAAKANERADQTSVRHIKLRAQSDL
jgi:GTP cyclohydrolase III